MGRVAARPSGRRVVVLLGICIAGLAQQQVFSSIPELVRKNARAAEIDPVRFLESIEQKAGEWRAGSEVAGRSEFMNCLRKVMTKSGFHMVIGGKSLGKTKIFKNLTEARDPESPVIYVDMRKTASTDALRCVQEEAKRKWMNKNPPWYRASAKVVIRESGKVGVKQGWAAQGFFQKLVRVFASGAAYTIAEMLNVTESTEFLTRFVSEGSSQGQVPIIIVDEANAAFPNGNGNGATTDDKKAAAETALRALVAESKQDNKACVILVASEYSFPYRLETLGFNKYDSLSIILAPEVEEEAMIEVLTKDWGMPQDLAEAFYEAFGGDIFLCDQALAKLVMRFSMGKEDLFDPYGIRDNFGLAGLVMNSGTRPHMENMAKQGWSPIDENSMENQTAAKKIAKMNFGAVIGRKTETFNLPFEGEMFKDETTTQVLIPTTQYMRKCIQRMVEAVKQKEEEDAVKQKEEEAARWKPPWEW